MTRCRILLLLGLLACSEDEVKRAAPGQMLAIIDGEERISTSISATIHGASVAGNPAVSIEGAFETPTGNFLIIVSASTQDIFKPISVGEYVVEGVDIPMNYGIIYYSPEGSSNSFVSFHVGGDEVGKIVLTQVDTGNKLISGRFECVVAHETTGETITIREGSFTQIPYTD